MCLLYKQHQRGSEILVVYLTETEVSVVFYNSFFFFFLLNIVKRQRKWMRCFYCSASFIPLLEFMEEMFLKLHYILEKNHAFFI